MKSVVSMTLAAGRKHGVSCVSLRGEKSVLVGHSSHTCYTFCLEVLGSLTDVLMGNESIKDPILNNVLVHKDIE